MSRPNADRDEAACSRYASNSSCAALFSFLLLSVSSPSPSASSFAPDLSSFMPSLKSFMAAPVLSQYSWKYSSSMLSVSTLMSSSASFTSSQVVLPSSLNAYRYVSVLTLSPVALSLSYAPSVTNTVPNTLLSTTVSDISLKRAL